MKVLHLAMHEGSGAGRAAARLHFGLCKEGIDSSLLVVQKSSDAPSVVKLSDPTASLKKLQGKVIGSKLSQIVGYGTTFSVNATPSLMMRQVKNIHANVINLHWVGWDYVRIEDLIQFRVPLIWTMQDMWCFTGGCHYSETCDRYINSCGACPQLRSGKDSDLSRWVWQRKANAWKNINLTIVAPGSWIAECAKQSSLFRDRRIEVIPFCLDTQVYKPIDQRIARDLIRLPHNKLIVLFGALSAVKDERKGFQFLLPALRSLSRSGWGDRIELVIFGASESENPIDLGFKAHYLGNLRNDLSLVQAYSAADVMIVPSTQESFGQTASESLACGTPVVAFNATGLKDIVDHQQNGYLAKPYEVEDLARGIAWVLKDSDRLSKLRYHAREKAERAFPLDLQAQRYISLYNELLDSNLR
jgi:glycosyltransferase involved in cell wall biosynthesis